MSEQITSLSKFKKWLPLLALPAVAGPVIGLVFVVRTELAHDESTCPYQLVSQRRLSDGALIVEQKRQCLEGVEEHRFLLRREGNEQVLGRRRFAPEVFEAPGFSWDGGVDDAGEVHIVVQNAGHEDALFREGRNGE